MLLTKIAISLASKLIVTQNCSLSRTICSLLPSMDESDIDMPYNSFAPSSTAKYLSIYL